jgi:hypothetical protein
LPALRTSKSVKATKKPTEHLGLLDAYLSRAAWYSRQSECAECHAVEHSTQEAIAAVKAAQDKPLFALADLKPHPTLADIHLNTPKDRLSNA